MTRIIAVLLLAFLISSGVYAQTGGPLPAATGSSGLSGKPAASNDIFSGVVTTSGVDSLTVVRKIPGRPDEARTFGVDRSTTVEGKLKTGARVTVRFTPEVEGGAHALRVIVRTETVPVTGTKKTQPARR